jgi:hypothetical protein
MSRRTSKSRSCSLLQYSGYWELAKTLYRRRSGEPFENQTLARAPFAAIGLRCSSSGIRFPEVNRAIYLRVVNFPQ